jgi:hypothetical protein
MAGSGERLAELPGRLQGLLDGFEEKQRRQRAASGDWSLHEIVCHLADYAQTFHAAISDPSRDVLTPFLSSTNDDRVDGYQSWALDEVIERLISGRGATVRALEGMVDADKERLLDHPRRGTVTVAWLLGRWADHEDEHLEEIVRLKNEMPAF